MAIRRFVYRRRHPEDADPGEVLTRTTRDGKHLTVVGGDTVSCSGFDPQTGKTDAWVGNWKSFEAPTR